MNEDATEIFNDEIANETLAMRESPKTKKIIKEEIP